MIFFPTRSLTDSPAHHNLLFETISLRTSDGEALLAWRDDGWIGSDMTALQSRPINGTTVAFIMQWNDRYENSPDELSCSWYLANRVEGEWKFTAYADSDCPGP